MGSVNGLLAAVTWCALGSAPALAQPTAGGGQAKSAPKAEPVLMDEMTMTEVRDGIASGKTTVKVFNGSTEHTGPHVVLGKHNFKARCLR
jgi:hypothetical protein